MKWMFRKIRQWSCTHPTIRAKGNAKHKQNANNVMRVQCLFCEKVMYFKGREIADKWSIEKECHCTLGRE